VAHAVPQSPPPGAQPARNGRVLLFWLATAVLLVLLFRQSFFYWYDNVSRENSYYSHAVLVPFVSLFFVWRKKDALTRTPGGTSTLGYPLLVLSFLLVLGADLLGFRILGQAAILPLVVGLGLLFLGPDRVKQLWFPIAFLFFMIPIPESLTASVTFRVKMLAAEGAVNLANLVYLPMVRDGSYIHFADDLLLVGDVCSGLRSLIALLALGAVVAYLSGTRPWARVLVLAISAPIAIASNVLRIFFLCVVGYYYGSEIASGWVHDISGYLIYVVALVMLCGVERLLHAVAPAHNTAEKEDAE